MPRPSIVIDLDEITAVLDYDPTTGMLSWRTRPGVHAGGLQQSGYRQILVNGRSYKANRLAWAIGHGRDPGDMLIDHINGVRDDNRLVNLRLATYSINNQNHHGLRSTNSTGLRGVSASRPGTWQAQISVNGKQIGLGRYRTPEAASAAYESARRRYHAVELTKPC